jgi:maltose/moltooligosaccharide transporter
MWVFTTDAVATHVYGLTGEYAKSVKYNEAGNEVTSAFGIYNLVAMFYALALPFVASRIGRKLTHAISLVAGGIGLISIYFVKDPSHLWMPMIGVGLAWPAFGDAYVILSVLFLRASWESTWEYLFLHHTSTNCKWNFWRPIVKYLYGGQPIYAIMLAGFCLLAAPLVFYLSMTWLMLRKS